MLRASQTTFDPDILGTIGFVTDSMSHALLVGGYTSLGLGVLGLALREDRVGGAAFGRLVGVVLGIGLVALGILSLTDPSDLIEPLTGLVGIVLAPAWLWSVASGAALRTEAPDAMASHRCRKA